MGDGISKPVSLSSKQRQRHRSKRIRLSGHRRYTYNYEHIHFDCQSNRRTSTTKTTTNSGSESPHYHGKDIVATGFTLKAKKVTDCDIVRDLVDSDLDPKTRCLFLSICLLWASFNGYSHLIRPLVQAGGNPNFKMRECRCSPISAAANNGHFQTVEALIWSGATECFYSALLFAKLRGHYEIAEFLVDAGAKKRKKHEPTKLSQFAIDEMKLMKGWRLLNFAVHFRCLDLIETLIQFGADLEYERCCHRTALMQAAEEGFADVVDCLIKCGASLLRPEVLLLASSSRHIDVIQLLIRNGVDVNGSDAGGASALMFAAQAGDVEIIEYLSEHGANINAIDENGSTALVYAIINHKHKAMEKLLALGADVNIVPKGSETTSMVEIAKEHSNQRAEAHLTSMANASFEDIEPSPSSPPPQRSRSRMAKRLHRRRRSSQKRCRCKTI